MSAKHVNFQQVTRKQVTIKHITLKRATCVTRLCAAKRETSRVEVHARHVSEDPTKIVNKLGTRALASSDLLINLLGPNVPSKVRNLANQWFCNTACVN